LVVLVMSACAVPATIDLNQTEVDLFNTEQVDDLGQSVELVSDEIEVPDPSAAAGYGPGVESHQATISALSDTELSQSEIDGLIFMLEEEKLARDVYLYLADVWNMNVFANISNSEQAHMDSVLTLIILFEAQDPVRDNGLGEFTNQDLQTLYDELTVKGNLFLADAMMVGGAIEEIDILDLQEYLAQTSNSAVFEVYQNLLRGSINHLQAFVRTYERQTGETYGPQFLSQEEYQELLASSSVLGTGQGRGMNTAPKGFGQGRQY
ncbi:MAG: DUF2202 domain-containing protein, partial [Anaerolineales bacterium]|nr:DUF2202 domain-containing protein [Anaerolineales bacterium]